MFQKNRKKKDDKAALLFPFPHILSWCSPPESAASHFQKIQNSLKYGAQKKKYGRSELNRKGTQEPKNGTEQPKQNETNIWKKWGS